MYVERGHYAIFFGATLDPRPAQLQDDELVLIGLNTSQSNMKKTQRLNAIGALLFKEARRQQANATFIYCV